MHSRAFPAGHVRHATGVRVRRATATDSAGVAAAYLEAWRAGYEGLLDATRLETEATKRADYDWYRVITCPDRVVFVAEEGGTIVGVAECEHDPHGEGRPWLHMLYLVPSIWGSGVAGALVDAALAEAHRAGRRAVWLEVVEAQARARRFYEREGWRLDETLPPTSNGLFRLLHYRHDA